MSESEKKKRLEYRRKRRTLLLVQTIIAIIIGVAIVFSSLAYFRIDANYNVFYTQQSAIDYNVYLKPNNEYQEDYLGKDQSYIATLIDYVAIDFDYKIDLDSEWAEYDVNYFIDATLTIKDNTNKKPLFTRTYMLKDAVVFKQVGSNKLLVDDSINISYDQYNNFATNFINAYNLSDVSCYLDVAMHVSTTGKCEEFKNTDFGNCAFSLNIPLTKKTIEINMISSIPEGKQSAISCENCVNKNLFKYLALGFGGLEIVALLVLVIYVYTTRNHDINYEIKIKRLVSAYKSYIQKILSEFCFDGYQILKVDTFNEMLDIRDTINSPILMSENLDKTCTKFLIPTDNGILYMHEIRVEDYDEIYSNPTTEEQAITVDTPDYRSGVKYDYSFVSKLHLSSEDTRSFYQEIVSFISSYGLKINRSWNKERVQIGRKTYAILSFRGLKLTVSFALNPLDFENTKYKLKDVSSVKKFANVPAQMKVTSARKAKWVKELFTIMLKADGVEDKCLAIQTPKIKAKSKAKLIKENLIKID